MMPFTSIDDWTLDTISDLLARGGEPGWYDWKEVLRAPKESYQRLCTVVCGMANTDGGYVIFGVTDKGAVLEDRIVGIALNNEEGHDFGQMIDKIRPDVRFVPKTILLPNGKGLFVVHVPQSQRRPHMNQRDYKFHQRGDGGNAKPMEYQQVRDLMIDNEERQRKVDLFRVKLAHFYRLAVRVQGHGSGVHGCFDRFDTTFFDNLLVEIWSAIPSGFLVEALMQISESANRINNALNLAATPGMYGAQQGLDQHYLDQFNRDLDFILVCTADCTKRLDEAFEPLPPDLDHPSII